MEIHTAMRILERTAQHVLLIVRLVVCPPLYFILLFLYLFLCLVFLLLLLLIFYFNIQSRRHHVDR